MERAEYIPYLRPTIILCIIAFLLTIILPLESARCDDRCIVIINGKKIDDPVVVPDMDFGEPGSSPWVTGSNLSDTDDNVIDNNKSVILEGALQMGIKSYWFFIRYMLNQILCGN